ncbi:MAG: MarR family transcriptional regulator [Pseudomonadota bacterium]
MPHTVRSLARQLAISKPAVTRAVASLAKLGLVRRRVDPRNRRSVLVERTVKGAVSLSEMGARIAAAAAPPEPAQAEPIGRAKARQIRPDPPDG